MDPNATLATLRELCTELLSGKDGADPSTIGGEIAEAFENLDEWITKGGFLPSDWQGTRG